MSQLQKGIEKACNLAFDYFSMDTFFIDPSSNKKIEYNYSGIPQPLTPYFGKIICMLNLHDQSSEYDVLFHSTPYRLNFISAKVYDDNNHLGSIVVGPYLLEEPNILMIEAMISENNLSISLKNIIKQYYLSLPLIGTYKANSIAEFLAYTTSNLKSLYSQSSKIGNIEYNFQTDYSVSLDIIKRNNELSIDFIEKRYAHENALLYAVESGDRDHLENIHNKGHSLFTGLYDRIPNDPLRTHKNLSFVFNTLLRKATERGGVHPIYIDAVSEKFAIQIEKCTSIQQLSDLNKKMVIDYCDTVRKFSLKGYSYAIRKAIDYIRINLDQDLSLETISSSINVNAYKLSRQFKQETGKSITEYITIQRINEAMYILENEKVSITDVAYMVGFNDANYFTKAFKKVKGITPSEFRKGKK